MGLDIYLRKTRRDSDELAYFRKVNFLVNYFFGEDYTDGDNCRPLTIYKEQCEDLIERCKTVLEKRNEETSLELLPPIGGFFFGNTNIDDYYYKDVEEVKTQFEDFVLPQFDGLADNEVIEFTCWW